MKKTLLIILFAVVTISAQNILKTTTNTNTFVTSISVDSVQLEKFIERYIARNSVKSTHTVLEIDNAVNIASAGSSVTVGTLTPSGFYVNTGSGTVVSSKQLNYRNILINGAVATKVLTAE